MSKDLVEFTEKRNDLIKSYNNCTSKNQNQTNEKYHERLKSLPACIKQLTRQICKCERNCFDKLFKNLGLSLECQDKNTVINLFSNEYIDCRIFNLRIVDGKIVDPNNISYNNIKQRMKNILENICNENFNEFVQLECIVYEIKDICSFDIECIESFIPFFIPPKCLNELYRAQLKALEDMIGVPIFNIDLKLEKDESRAERSIDDQKYILNDIRSIDDRKNIINDNSAIQYHIHENYNFERNLINNDEIYSKILIFGMIAISIICGLVFFYNRKYSRKPVVLSV